MTYEYYPLQNTLPFLDLLPVEENLSAEITALKTVASNSDATIEKQSSHEKMLLFCS